MQSTDSTPLPFRGGGPSSLSETRWVLESCRPEVKPNPASFNLFMNLRVPQFLNYTVETVLVPAFCSGPEDKEHVLRGLTRGIV